MAALLVESTDGTRVSSEIYGEGRPLVVVSGALFRREGWLPSVPLLSAERRVYLVDRRGRGKSGNTLPYAPEREVEDLLAVLAGIEGPVDLLGSSSGAILALQTAARVPRNLARLIAYEPPVFLAAEDRIAQDLPERLDALLATGQPDAAVETFLREGPRISEAELERRRASLLSTPRVDTLAYTVAYDARVQRGFQADAAELARIQIPTLMLIGGASPKRMRSGSELIATRLPHAQVAELEGQEHLAMLTSPVVFSDAVNRFLDAR